MTAENVPFFFAIVSSKWCTNVCHPPMETYIKIAKLLEVELTELVYM